ncbi:MAG: hypothetical protein HY917_04900 [Candidatus Diapherotrites archaeon]|nr:hypothetical protein [Candidatus Diapherotrites archaeon]
MHTSRIGWVFFLLLLLLPFGFSASIQKVHLTGQGIGIPSNEDGGFTFVRMILAQKENGENVGLLFLGATKIKLANAQFSAETWTSELFTGASRDFTKPFGRLTITPYEKSGTTIWKGSLQAEQNYDLYLIQTTPREKP